jgi:hypothetical protein
VRALEIVEVLPLLKLGVEEFGVVHHHAGRFEYVLDPVLWEALVCSPPEYLGA